MISVKLMNPPQTCDAPAKGHHVCECYGHTQELPDYKKLSVPRILPHYAVHGGCPCIPKLPAKNVNTLYCSTNPGTRGRGVRPKDTYRAYGPGPHNVYPAAEMDDPNARDAVTGERVAFPNSRNYGGTVAQHRFPAIGLPLPKTKEQRTEERMQDRKEFLKAVLRDEMRDRFAAEAQREGLENELGLRGSRHAKMLELEKSGKQGAAEDEDRTKTVADQYNEIMDELQYVLKQPVGSKWNIIRMHYLLEEQDRINYHRKGESNELKLYTWR